MTFSEQLNRYLEQLECPANRLSGLTGIAPYTLSKYRSGIRRPEASGKTVEKLAQAIRTIAEEKGIQSILEIDIAASLKEAILSETDSFDFDLLIKRLKLLMQVFNVSLTEISEMTNYSRATIYSVWRGKSKLRDPEAFVRSLARFIADRFGDMNGQMKASKMIGWPELLFETKSGYMEAMAAWLSGEYESELALSGKKLLDSVEFNLNEFQRESRFGEVSLPKTAVSLPKFREYFGMQGMADGIADFIKATTLSRSYKNIILYSDFPVNFLFEKTRAKLWAEGLALALQKGVNVKYIHCSDRPIDEVVEGLQIWIPMYMSGRIMPLYVENKKSHFHNCLLASGGAALKGSSITGEYDDASFQLFTAGEAVSREYRLAEHLVSRAKPLLETDEDADQAGIGELFRSYGADCGKIAALLSSPPVHSISDELLEKILVRNRVGEKDAKKIRTYIRQEKKRIDKSIAQQDISLCLSGFMKHEFESYPVRLDLSDNLSNLDIFYSYDEYKQHISETRRFAEERERYQFVVNNNGGFRNIQIVVLGDAAVLVQKTKPPRTRAVLRNAWMVKAISRVVEHSICEESKK